MRATDYGQLVKRAKNGDTSAFEEIYNNCYAYVYFTCQSYFDNKEDIEDVVQETLFEAFRDIHKLNDDNSFLAWLKKISIHQCYDKYDKLKKDIENIDKIENTGDLVGLEIEELNKAFLPSAYCEDNEMRAELLGVVNTLPESQKKMIHLYYYGEFNTTEIAKLHGCSDGYVRKALFTARNNIKERLQATGTYGSFVPLGAIFLAEEADFVAKYLAAGTYVAGTGAAIASAAMQGTSAAGVGVAAFGAGAGVTTASAGTGAVVAKTAVSTYVAIAVACVLTTGLIAGGVYYAIMAPNSQEEATIPTVIGLTESAQYGNMPSGVDDYEYYKEYEPYYTEQYYNNIEYQDGTSDTNQTANDLQEDISVVNSGFYEEADNYEQIPIDEKPEPVVDNTAEILSALSVATTASDVAGIINRNGFSRLPNIHGSNGEILRFYYVNKGSGDILIGVREDEWLMKFRFFENNVINMRTLDLVFWMES